MLPDGMITRVNKKESVSIVISVYNEEENIHELYRQISKYLKGIPKLRYELIFVNDGSTDGSLELVKEFLNSDPSIKIVNLARNFGHEIAMTAGTDFANGDAVLYMDADLQHPPSLIPEIIGKWRSGADIVLTNRTDNDDQSRFQKWKGKIFYKILNSFSDTYIPPQAPDFRLISRKYVDVLKEMKENNRMFRGLISWLGAPNQVVIDFKAPKRFRGETKYNTRKLVKLAVDSLVSFSIKPLRIATYIGILAAFLSILLGVFFTYSFLTSDTYDYTGYGTTIVMVIFIGSVQLIVLGIIGEYLGRIHLEIKKRPLYIAELLVSDSIINNNEKDNTKTK
jgi:dolichol-phosphate mannosyltransferase